MLIMKRLKNRRDYFVSFDKFINAYSSSVGFARITLPEIITKFKSSSKLFDEHLLSLKTSMTDSSAPTLKKQFLSKAEISFVSESVLGLGRYDSATEKANAQSVKEQIKSHAEGAADSWKKYGKSSIKLGFLFGLLIAVLCM